MLLLCRISGIVNGSEEPTRKGRKKKKKVCFSVFLLISVFPEKGKMPPSQPTSVFKGQFSYRKMGVFWFFSPLPQLYLPRYQSTPSYLASTLRLTHQVSDICHWTSCCLFGPEVFDATHQTWKKILLPISFQLFQGIKPTGWARFMGRHQNIKVSLHESPGGHSPFLLNQKNVQRRPLLHVCWQNEFVALLLIRFEDG